MPATSSTTEPPTAPVAEGTLDGSTDTRSTSITPENADLGLLAVVALAASLAGILGIAYSIYAFKFLGHHLIFYVPSRVFFVLSLGLVVAPFLLVILRSRIPYLVLLIPTALCFLMYPLLEPHGVVYGQDALFNFQFADSFLLHTVWVAGTNTTGQAQTYSFYPGSGLFNAEGSVFLGIPLTGTFAWLMPISRLLVLPPLIFAIGSRLFGTRAGILGVFLYLAAPSITFNDMTQQEFATQFFILTLAMITFSVYIPREHSTPLAVLVLVFSSFVILSHHLTSYVLGVWLAGLGAVPLLLWGRPAFEALRSGVVALRYFALFLLYVFFLTASVLLGQLEVLETNIVLLLSSAPLSSQVATTGSSYPTYQLAWIIAGLAIVILFAVLALREALRGRPRPYLTTSLVLAAFVMIVAFVLFATPYSFVAIRTTEYALVFAGPAAAWYLIRRFMPKIDRRVRGSRPGASRTLRRSSLAWVAPVIAIAIALLIFTGGNLVPGLSRDQFQPTQLLTVNSPMRVTAAVYQDGVWARTHLVGGSVWGDSLVYDVYAAIGGMSMPFDTYTVFNGTNLTAQNFLRLHVGDFVVTDVYDTQLTPSFYGPGTDQPIAPLTPTQVAKFNDPAYLSVVFADPVFTVYQVTHIL